MRDTDPPHLPDGLITAGRWRGHFIGCLSTGCASTKCAPSHANRWLDETAESRRTRSKP